jgi:drug/metabolite transporter (DMT)-like permease
MLIYMPAYAIAAGTSVFDASPSAVALQALVQGLLTAVISYIVFGVAVGILGASSGAAFAASCPAMTALMAIPILGEWPSAIDWIAIALISIGVYVVSGGPLPGGECRCVTSKS